MAGKGRVLVQGAAWGAVLIVLALELRFLTLPDRGWFGHPVGVGYGLLWLLAAGGTAALVTRGRGSRRAWAWPYAAAGLLWGFVGPGLFSIAVPMAVAGLACLIAAWGWTPRPRGLVVTLAVALATTAVVLAIGAWL